MPWDSAAQHKTIMAVDIAGYNDPKRTTDHLLVVHEGFWDLMRTSFAGAGIPWDVCFTENTGDGAMIQLPAEVAKADLVTRLPDHLLAGLRRYNATKAEEAQVRLRIALHAGEVHQASEGTVSLATSFTFRILEAPVAKSALKESGAAFALIVSDGFYQDVVKQDAAADPGAYQRIPAEVKETRTEAWLRLVGVANGVAPLPRAAVATAPLTGKRREPGGIDLSLDEIWELTELLLAIPVVSDEGSRRVLLSWLRPEIRAMVPHHPQTRLHVLELVRTCARYQGGLTELVMTVQMLEPGSEPVRRLSDHVARWRTIEHN